jgi:membrane protease YdiL (CAAX protease family)
MANDASVQANRTSQTSNAPRVPASPMVAFGVFVAYLVVVNGIQFASGVPYTAFFASAGNAMRSAVASLAAGSAILLAFAVWSRWDRLWRDAKRLPMTRLMWVAPVTMILFIVARVAMKLAGGVSPGLLGAIVLAGIGVGLAEELLFRGIVLRSLRTHGRPEAQAMLLSSLWFGAMHLTNALLGASFYAALLQSGIAAVQGATLYQFRRATGLLAAGMVVHGLWDISAFLPAGPATAASRTFEAGALAIMLVVGLISGIAVLRHDRRARSRRAA